MRYSEAERLRSEIGTVQRFLAELGEEDFIERMSWQSRLANLRNQLTELERTPQPIPLSLTFRGVPVEGTRSIDATFASNAVRAFVEATNTVAASLQPGGLGRRGPLPGDRTRSLRIVDTAIGSFGFELELPPPEPDEAQQPLFDDEGKDPYAEAIVLTLKLLDQAAPDDEDAISDSIAVIHRRAANKIHAFASVLAESNALASVAFQNRSVRLEDETQVARVVEALADADISEEVQTVRGAIGGILPRARRFEARLQDGRNISGTIDRSVADIGTLKAHSEGVEAELKVRVVQVRSRTRYALLAAEPLQATPSDCG